MQFAPLAGGVGAVPINLYNFTASTTAQQMPGFVLEVADPYWGSAEVIYGKAAGVIPTMALCQYAVTAGTNVLSYDFIVAADTANSGREVFVAMQSMASGDYGWFMRRGTTPVASAASVAADTAWGIGAAGQGGAISTGKQILNSRCQLAATRTVAKTNSQADSGSLFLNVTNSDGWFEGIYLSGTGIAAGAYVVSIAPGGRVVTMSAVTTAAVNGTVTGTYNNATIYYNVVTLNNSFVQGQDAT